MRANNVFILLLVVLCCYQAPAQSSFWSERLTKKVEATIETTYPDEDDMQIMHYSTSAVREDLGFDEFWNNLFKVENSDSLIGYAYISQAASMKNVYDYIVIFSPSFDIVKSKVLIYREKHGQQIGHKRWLSQFNKMNILSRPILGKEVDGISGATISSQSMTKAIYNLLERLDTEIKMGKIKEYNAQ